MENETKDVLLPDTRGIPLGQLVGIGALSRIAPKRQGAPAVAAFNASL